MNTSATKEPFVLRPELAARSASKSSKISLHELPDNAVNNDSRLKPTFNPTFTPNRSKPGPDVAPSPRLPPATKPKQHHQRAHASRDNDSDSENDEHLPPERLRRSSAPTLRISTTTTSGSQNSSLRTTSRHQHHHQQRQPPPNCDLRYDATVGTTLAYVNAKLANLRVVQASEADDNDRLKGSRFGAKKVGNELLHTKDKHEYRHIHNHKHRGSDRQTTESMERMRCMRKFL